MPPDDCAYLVIPGDKKGVEDLHYLAIMELKIIQFNLVELWADEWAD